MFENLTEALEGVNLNDLRESNPTLYGAFMDDAEKEWDKKGAEIWAKKILQAREEAASELRLEFADRLQQALQGTKEDLTESIRKELLADPQVAGAKGVLDEVRTLLRPYVIPEDVEAVVSEREEVIAGQQLMVEQQQVEIDALTEQNNQLAAIAKEAGYRYHCESLLQGNPHADTIRNILGDLSQFENVEAMDEAVASIVKDIQENLEGEQAHSAEVSALRSENDQLREAVAMSVEASQQLMLAKYINERLDNHPEAGRVRQIIEAADPSSKDEVDSLLEQVSTLGTAGAPSMEEARQRVRDAMGNSGTREYLQEHAERGNKGVNGHPVVENWNGIGQTLSEVRELSGYEEPIN